MRRLPGRRQRPRLPRLLRPAGGAADGGRVPDERAARDGEHADEAPGRLPPGDRARGLGREAHRAHRARRRVQGPPAADARPAAPAGAVFRADRRGVRLSQPARRRQGGRRRHRHACHEGGGGRPQGLRGLDRPGRLPARLRERLHHDDAAGGVGRGGLHARADRPALRHRPRARARLHRPQGRHVGQHPGGARHRRQDGGRAPGQVRVDGGRLREPRRRPGREAAREPAHGGRRRGAIEAACHHRPPPRHRRRLRRARGRAAGPLLDEGALPQARAARDPEAPGRARGGGPGSAGGGARRGRDRLARGRSRGCARARARRRARRRRRPGGGDGRTAPT